jgi:hypothetical protein
VFNIRFRIHTHEVRALLEWSNGLGYVARIAEIGSEYKILVAKSESNTLLVRPRHRRQDGSEIAVKEMGCELDSPGSG